MAKVTVLIDQAGLEPEAVVLELSLETLTMRESVRLEETLGPEVFAELVAGRLEATARPSLIRAIIYAKLKTERPEVTLESFDLDLTALAAAFEAEEPPRKKASAGSSSE
jgi:hypothetical protein